MLPFSSKARVLSLIFCRPPPPAPLARSQTEDKRHRIVDATTCLPKLSKIGPIGAAVSDHSAGRRSFELRTGISAGFRRKSFAELAMRHPARRMLVASRVPVNPPRDFFFPPRFRCRFEAFAGLLGHAPFALATCRSEALLTAAPSVS